ncbi:MAG: hypothetical protein Q9M97_02835 [Candidatus Gracilibacteria bacterium]|nr:hypothetical protein [Candidatus Gracilibacteria bacterium]
MSASGMQYAASSFKSDIETKSRNTGSKITSLFLGSDAKMMESINGLKGSIDNLGLETTDTAK